MNDRLSVYAFMKPEFHYRIQNSMTWDLTLSQLNLAHTFIPYFTKIRFNIILPSTLRSLHLPIPSTFSNKKLF
jgi:hypothetical protein